MPLRTQEGITRGTRHVELANQLRLALLCSDAISSVPRSEHVDALPQVHQPHSTVIHSWVEDKQATSEDSVEFELAAEFGAEREDPGRARRMLVAALERSGYEDTLVHDAGLILTELAANAVVHAGSPFS